MLHYVACGLPNVYLKNGYEETDTPSGKVFKIKDLKGLHHAIAMGLVKSDAPLTSDEFRFLRTELGLSRTTLAGYFGLSSEAIKKKESGENPIRRIEDIALRQIYAEAKSENSSLSRIFEKIGIMERELAHAKRNENARLTEHGWEVSEAAA